MRPSDSAWDRQVRAGDSSAQRADRNFADLLQELRITLTGSQILFAFLLVVPFSGGFRQVTGFQRALYVAVLVTSALSAGLLVAPAAIHRITFRLHLKAELVRIAGSVAGLLGSDELRRFGAVTIDFRHRRLGLASP